MTAYGNFKELIKENLNSEVGLGINWKFPSKWEAVSSSFPVFPLALLLLYYTFSLGSSVMF